MKKKTDIMQIAAHEAMTIDQLLYIILILEKKEACRLIPADDSTVLRSAARYMNRVLYKGA